MTRLEFNAFVIDEIQGRWPKWDPTPVVLDDWYGILRNTLVDIASAVISEHFTNGTGNRIEPRIDVVAAMIRKANQRRDVRDIPEALEPWVRCTDAPSDHPEWEGLEWCRGEFCMSSNSGSREHVATAASMAAASIQSEHGGRWTGVVRTSAQSPLDLPDGEAGKQAYRRHVLAGPNGPQKRMLESLRGSKMLPGVLSSMTPAKSITDPLKTVATRQDLDRMSAEMPRKEPVAAQGLRSTPGGPCDTNGAVTCNPGAHSRLPPTESEQQSDEEFFAANPVEADNQGWERG